MSRIKKFVRKRFNFTCIYVLLLCCSRPLINSPFGVYCHRRSFRGALGCESRGERKGITDKSGQSCQHILTSPTIVWSLSVFCLSWMQAAMPHLTIAIAFSFHFRREIEIDGFFFAQELHTVRFQPFHQPWESKKATSWQLQGISFIALLSLSRKASVECRKSNKVHMRVCCRHSLQL